MQFSFVFYQVNCSVIVIIWIKNVVSAALQSDTTTMVTIGGTDVVNTSK